MKDATRHPGFKIRYQSGVVTIFTGVLMLVLLTLMMFFAMRVGVYEQRVSANEMRQKLAFHAAESGIHHAKEFIRKNSPLVASDREDALPNGWLSDTVNKRWLKCSEAGLDLVNDSGTHPCFGESVPAVRPNTYFYSFSGSRQLPLNTNDLLPGSAEEVTVEALLCVLDVDTEAAIPVQGCSLDPATAVGVADGTYFLVTLLARGGADCDGATCNAEALVHEQVSNFGAGAGGRSPAVPLTTKSSFPPSGSAENRAQPQCRRSGRSNLCMDERQHQLQR